MTVDELLGRLVDVRQHGDYWKARCPAHEDDHASLSVRDGEKAIVLRCHAGCDFRDITGALGIEPASLFHDSRERQRVTTSNGAPRPPRPRAPIIAHYDYVDAEGMLLYQACRRSDKEFTQRRPDGNGDWIYSLGNVQPVLYRLPAVLAAKAARQTVWIVEGEKDVHTLEGLGLVATTAPMGAGKWRVEYAATLAGAQCIVLPDNDDAGKQHVFGAERVLGVAPSLLSAGCRVRVLELPGLAPKGDVSDWIAAGGTKKHLLQLAKETPDWPPTGDRQYTDLGNAYRLADRYKGELLYCDVWDGWLTWGETHWMRDRTRDVETRAHEMIEHLYREAWTLADKGRQKAQAKFALTCQSDRAISALIRRARALPAFKATPEQFDGRPWLLNVENGTIDLSNGKLLPHRREDYLTQICPVAYEPDAQAPRWEQFVLEIMAGKEHLAAFLQRAIGYCLTGSDQERVLFLLWGGGNNGKSTFLDVIRKLLGDYGHKLRREALMARKLQAGAASPEIAGLRGKRFAYLSETEEGGRIDEAFVKELTGREYIRTRDLYEKEMGFTPEFKLWIGTNHKPVIRGMDDAIWNRLPLLPFPVRFVDADPDTLDLANPLIRPMDRTLSDTLMDELPGILAWGVRGCLAWQDKGLRIPAEIIEATSEYRRESDFIQAFMDECTTPVFGMKCRLRDCHERYLHWAGNNEAPLLSQRKLTPLIAAKGYSTETSTGGYTFWMGFSLVDDRAS